jgi:hypothetical protein
LLARNLAHSQDAAIFEAVLHGPGAHPSACKGVLIETLEVGVGIGIGVAIAIAIVLPFDTDSDPEGSSFTTIFESD